MASSVNKKRYKIRNAAIHVQITLNYIPWNLPIKSANPQHVNRSLTLIFKYCTTLGNHMLIVEDSIVCEHASPVREENKWVRNGQTGMNEFLFYYKSIVKYKI